jgi:phosphate transport system protein
MTHLEEELLSLKKEVQIMFALVETQLIKTQKAILSYDTNLAREVKLTEKRVNGQELKIDRDCENIFALYQPVAVDLRYVLAILKINNNLERSGDIAKGLVKPLLDLDGPFDPQLLSVSRLPEMLESSLQMLEHINLAFDSENTELARSIFKADELLDEINKEAHQTLTQFIMQNPALTGQALHILSAIRKLERLGDQFQNIAEELVFYVEAKVLKHNKKGR